MDQLAWDVRFWATRQGTAGEGYRTQAPILSFADHAPVARGQWAEVSVPTDQAATLDLYHAEGAGLVAVLSDHLLKVTVNGQDLYGSQLVLGTAEVETLAVEALGQPVDGGELTASTDRSLTDTRRQWRYGVLEGLVCYTDTWADDEQALDFILDVNGRVARIKVDAPIDWRNDNTTTAGEDAAAALNGLVDASLIGAHHVAFVWDAAAERFVVRNLQRGHAPIIRPRIPDRFDWLNRLGLVHTTARHSPLNPVGYRLRITAGAHRGQHRTIETVDATGQTVGWPGGEALASLAPGDSYRLLKTDPPASVQWIVLDRGAT